MFPGGIDPDQIRRIQEQTERALQSVDLDQIRRTKEQIEQGIDPDQIRRIQEQTERTLQGVDLDQIRRIQDVSRIYVDVARALRPMPTITPGAMQSLESAA